MGRDQGGDDDEARLRAAVLDAGIGTWSHDVRTNRLVTNELFAQIFGIDPRVPRDVSTMLTACVHPDDLPRVHREIERSRRERVRVRYRCRIIRERDEAVRWIELTGGFRYDDDDNPLEAFGTVRDVTTEVEATEALAVSRRRLQLAVNGTQTAAWEWRLEDDVVVHESPPTSLGFTLEDMPKTRSEWAKHGSPDGDALNALFEDVAAGRKELGDVDIRVPAKSGELRWLKVRVASIRDAAGKVVRVVGTSVDITHQKADEEQLRAQHRLLEEIVEHLPIMVTFYDAESTSITWVNRAAETILGWPRSAWRAPNFVSELVAQEAARSRAIAFMRAGGTTEWRHIALRRPDGRVVETAWCAVRLPDGSMMGIGQDLTFELQLQQTQKLESLGVLAGGIAHDFNNLLVGILTNAHLARSELKEGPMAEVLSDIERSAERLAELTRQLLAYAGKGRLVVQPFDLAHVVREMTSLLTAALSKHATIHVDVPPSLPTLEGDVTQIRQVVMNLITNASDALGDGAGDVHLRSEVVTFDEPKTFEATGSLAAGRYVVLEVEDTGAGMTPETMRRIFEPFFTTKVTGRGLGLAATVGIVRRHGGALEVTSEVGKGSRFRLYLPVLGAARTEASGGPPSASAPARSPSEGPPTLLVVEDDPLVATVARRILERHGYVVVVARDVEEGARVLTERGPSLSAVLLDHNTPRGDTSTFLQDLQRDWPSLPVVVTSGSSEALARAEERGVAGVLPKPFGHDELVAAVAAVAPKP